MASHYLNQWWFILDMHIRNYEHIKLWRMTSNSACTGWWSDVSVNEKINNDLKVCCLVATGTLATPLLFYCNSPTNGQYRVDINPTPTSLRHAWLSWLFLTYTLCKKGCYTPIEDNKTNVDQIFVFPLGWNWHDMDPWLFPNEIRHYLGQTFNARSSGIVELRNHSIGGCSPKSIFTLWQLWINICIFFQKFFWLFEQCRPTPMGIRHEVFALAREGIKQGAIAARVGLTRAIVNRILKRHAATGSLVPGKSSGAPQKTTPRQDRALLRMVRQDRFLSAGALTARMRNLYGMRAGRTFVNNRLLAEPDSGPLAACHLRWWVEIPTLFGRWQA